MRTGTKSIKLLYKPLNAYRNTKIVSGSVRQNYDTNTLYFEPDRRIDPLVVLVECGVNDPHNFKNGLVNADLTNVTWKISKAGTLVDILDSDKEFQIGKAAEKGQLKVLKNIPDTEAVTLLFTAKYLEPTTKRVVNFQETFTLITSPIAAAPALLELSAPYGHNLFPTKGTEGLVCQADLWRGTKPVAAAYYWYKNGVEITDTNGFQNSKTNKLYVPAAQIPKTGQVYKVEVADCGAELQKLQNEWIDKDAKVTEWKDLFLKEQNVVQNSRNFKVRSFWTYTIGTGSSNIDFIDSKIRYTYNATGWNVFRQTSLFNTKFELNKKYVLKIRCRSDVARSVRFQIDNAIAAQGKHVFRTDLNTTNIFEDFLFIFEPSFNMENYLNFILPLNTSGFFEIEYIRIGVLNLSEEWSPSRFDIEALLEEKQKEAEVAVQLPPNYRPATKPNFLYKGDFMLMTKYPKIVEQIIGPEGGINPDIPNVDFEMVLNSADGVIENPEKYYSVGWLKQPNGTFKYKGFKIKIPIAEIIQLNAQNKELDYELREDLTLKP